MWDLPGPGLEPVSPELAGGFLTTVPPGKPQTDILNIEKYYKELAISSLIWETGMDGFKK